MKLMHLLIGGVATLAILLLLRPWLPGERMLLQSAPLIELLQTPTSLIQDLSSWAARQSDLHQQLLRSRQQLRRLSALRGEAAHLRQENRALRKLLAIHRPPPYRWLTAYSVTSSPDDEHRHLLLSVEGAAVDDAVVSEDGLVGIVTAASDRHATVRTVLDAAIAVAVTNRQQTLNALVHGEGDHLSIGMIARTRQPKVGDILYSSGAGGLIPRGIAVARITAIHPIPGALFVHVTAVPTAHWQRNQWLAVAHRPTDPYSATP